MSELTCRIDYPASQHYVTNALRRAVATVLPRWLILDHDSSEEPNLQFSDYDALNWDLLSLPQRQLSSYVIRKALIRKNHLSHTIALYLSKNPASVLSTSVPKSYTFSLSFPDELDELLQDELYELGNAFAEDGEKGIGERRWWILKAAMADRGDGIRLFSTREELEEIFEEFEVHSSDEEDEEEKGETNQFGQNKGTTVNASQMREWVVQEYLSHPLLLDPTPGSTLSPRKFHLRVYVLAVGALAVYVHHPYLALFAPTAYDFPPTRSQEGAINLASHLTNTCLQGSTEQIIVASLAGLVGHPIHSGPGKGELLGTERISLIEVKVGQIIAETFRAALNSGSGFQALPNCFEIFGCDLMVSETLDVSLLEINACPDFAQTGVELEHIIEDLFASTLRTAVLPFFSPTISASTLDEDLAALDFSSGGLRKVLQVEVSRAW